MRLTCVRETDRLPVNEGGWIRCPSCGAPHLKRIYPDEKCERLQLYCKRCRRATYVTISDGQCFQSPSL